MRNKQPKGPKDPGSVVQFPTGPGVPTQLTKSQTRSYRDHLAPFNSTGT